MIILLQIFFSILSIAFAISYFTSKKRFSPSNILLSLWFAAIAISQIRLSHNENIWNSNFWIILLSFLGLFILLYYLFEKHFDKKIKKTSLQSSNPSTIFFWLLILMTISSIIANIYIYWKFGTLPILSTQPDSFRFIINKKLFGLWEYIALFPRLSIPFSLFYIFLYKPKKWIKFGLWANIIGGFIILSLYASRLVIIFPILISYFSYLAINYDSFNVKKLAKATISVIVVVLFISIAIPAFRQSITYRDYNDPDAEKNPFTYISSLSGISVPDQWKFIVPVYIIPSFNLQAMMRATDYYNYSNISAGAYSLSTFNPALKYFGIQLQQKIPWGELFLPWWVTGTFLLSWWVDFWYFGIILASIFLAVILSVFYLLAIKKPSFLTISIFSYLSFITIMTIYTNYFQRSELYIDLTVILVCSIALKMHLSKKVKRSTI